jgi:hypothetical protein
MVKGGYGPIKQVTLDPSRCSRSNAATVGRPGRPFHPGTPLYLAVRKRTSHEPILPIKNWLVQLLAVLAKRLMDKGLRFVGAHVLKVHKRPRSSFPNATAIHSPLFSRCRHCNYQVRIGALQKGADSPRCPSGFDGT